MRFNTSLILEQKYFRRRSRLYLRKKSDEQTDSYTIRQDLSVRECQNLNFVHLLITFASFEKRWKLSLEGDWPGAGFCDFLALSASPFFSSFGRTPPTTFWFGFFSYICTPAVQQALQPILLCSVPHGSYQRVFGFRRRKKNHNSISWA